MKDFAQGHLSGGKEGEEGFPDLSCPGWGIELTTVPLLHVIHRRSIRDPTGSLKSCHEAQCGGSRRGLFGSPPSAVSRLIQKRAKTWILGGDEAG